MSLDPAVIETLKGVSTATLTTMLLKKGLTNVWMRGTKRLKPGQERVEDWIMTEIDRGVPLHGLSPLNTETKARYRAWKDAQ